MEPYNRIPPGSYVEHVDGDLRNNDTANLRIVTPQHSYGVGKRGRPRSLVTLEQVAELRRAPERWTWMQIAERLGVSSDTAEKRYREYMSGVASKRAANR